MTYGLEVRCSIQLNYESKTKFLSLQVCEYFLVRSLHLGEKGLPSYYINAILRSNIHPQTTPSW